MRLRLEMDQDPSLTISLGELWMGDGCMRFEFLSEMFDHLVCKTRDPNLTIGFLDV